MFSSGPSFSLLPRAEFSQFATPRLGNNTTSSSGLPPGLLLRPDAAALAAAARAAPPYFLVSPTPHHHHLGQSVTPAQHQHNQAILGAADHPSAFVNAVMRRQLDFSSTYSLLRQICAQYHQDPNFDHQQQQQQTKPSPPGTPSIGREDVETPVTGSKRLADISVEPMKLNGKCEERRPLKRMRSSTLIEEPPELRADTDEDELSLSRCSTPPSAIKRMQISPSKMSLYRSSVSSPRHPAPLEKTPRQVRHGIGGERRLTIHFLDQGVLENPIQTFGKFRLRIPNGLTGTHTMYAQPWKFEIRQVEGCTPGEAGEVCLRWTVTNDLSKRTITYVETPEQAKDRQVRGNTICNLVVREALNRRAEELEAEMQALGSASTRVANLRSLVKELRPKQCTEGLLFFGLRHKVAQRPVPE